MAIMERKNQGSFSKKGLIKMTIMRCKVGMVSFLNKLETWEKMFDYT